MCDKGNRQPSFITHHIEHSFGLYDIYNVKELIPTKMCSLKWNMILIEHYKLTKLWQVSMCGNQERWKACLKEELEFWSSFNRVMCVFLIFVARLDEVTYFKSVCIFLNNSVILKCLDEILELNFFLFCGDFFLHINELKYYLRLIPNLAE